MESEAAVEGYRQQVFVAAAAVAVEAVVVESAAAFVASVAFAAGFVVVAVAFAAQAFVAFQPALDLPLAALAPPLE